MFFSTYVLTKKGPLAKVWLAAHWEKRLTKDEVKVVDLSQTIVHIVRPAVPIALRTSGELLVGVVRIYALKVKTLLKEANDATLILRVSTMANTKGHRVSGKNSKSATSIDGVLVNQAGGMEAVTFDWDADRNGKRGTIAEAAEALCEARFDAIADLLGNGKKIEGPDGGHDALMATAWYTVQPNSQAADELHNSQQDYDAVAKMRHDLLAYGDRASNSVSTSKSNPSMERGRGSVLDADGIPFPPVTDEFDLGVPLPDEVPSAFPMLGAVDMPENPFEVPDMAVAERAARRPRAVNVLDLVATTLSRDIFEKYMQSRSDIVNSEPRRGPCDVQEEKNRRTLAGCEEALPLSDVGSAALRGAYAALLQQSLAVAAEEALAAQQLPGGRLSALPEEEVAPIEEEEEQRKRHREEEEAGNGGLGVSAQKTLQRVCAEATRQTKRQRSEGACSCTLQNVCHGMRRREAARTFVDILALASKQFLGVEQQRAAGEVRVTLKEAALAMTA